jgi:hypothetical protein
LIKPGKSLAEGDIKSVRKRMKDKAFARKVNRDDIIGGAAALDVAWASTSASASKSWSRSPRNLGWTAAPLSRQPSNG